MDIYYKNRITGNAILISNSFYIQQGKMSELFGNWEIKIFFRKKTVIGGQSIFPKKDYILDKIIDCIENKIEYGK